VEGNCSNERKIGIIIATNLVLVIVLQAGVAAASAAYGEGSSIS
jgi:hypothetical protein